MMFGSKKIAELEDKIWDLETQLERVKAERDSLRSLINGERAKVRDEECVFDFDTMKAFSVERLFDSDGPKTVIGYIRPSNQEIGEWSLYCSDIQHERLVAEFKAKLGS
jgi:hypothetical protein